MVRATCARQKVQEQARSELSAELLVTCPAGQRARVDLSYLVGGAAWSAAHEARLGGDAREEQVELSSYATITQATGEDWSAVPCRFSTARPAPLVMLSVVLSSIYPADRREELVKDVTVPDRSWMPYASPS